MSFSIFLAPPFAMLEVSRNRFKVNFLILIKRRRQGLKMLHWMFKFSKISKNESSNLCRIFQVMAYPKSWVGAWFSRVGAKFYFYCESLKIKGTFQKSALKLVKFWNFIEKIWEKMQCFRENFLFFTRHYGKNSGKYYITAIIGLLSWNIWKVLI